MSSAWSRFRPQPTTLVTTRLTGALVETPNGLAAATEYWPDCENEILSRCKTGPRSRGKGIPLKYHRYPVAGEPLVVAVRMAWSPTERTPTAGDRVTIV